MTTTETSVMYTRKELLAQIEQGARDQGMSLSDLVTAYRERTIQNHGELVEVLVLLDLLPAADPLFAKR